MLVAGKELLGRMKSTNSWFDATMDSQDKDYQDLIRRTTTMKSRKVQVEFGIMKQPEETREEGEGVNEPETYNEIVEDEITQYNQTP